MGRPSPALAGGVGSWEVPPRRIRDPTGRRFAGKPKEFNTRGTQCQKQWVGRRCEPALAGLGYPQQGFLIHQDDLATPGANEAQPAELAHHPDGGLDGGAGHIGDILPG